MGGPGSGRSGYQRDWDFEQLITKSLAIQIRFFDNPEIPDEKKVEYASRYLAKKVGEKIELAVEHYLSGDQLNEIVTRLAANRPREIS